jgi:hypothetical protein
MAGNNLSIEKRLQEISVIQPEYLELWSIWNLNKQALEPILSTIVKDYPHYSFHDSSHSESILINIERLLGDDNIKRLSPTDLWLLLHVAYLHDFGMVILDTKLYEIWKSKEFQEYILEQCNSNDDDLKKAAETISLLISEHEKFDNSWPLDVKKAVSILVSNYCRSKHAEYSKEYIIDIKEIWGIDLGHNELIKNRLISLIGDISIIHTKPFKEVLKLHKASNGFRNDYVHPRLIACLLRLGDVLDLDNGRFNAYGEEIFGKRPKESKIHYEKHESTKHVLVTEEVIEVEADCKSDSVFRETRKWFDSLESEINNIRLSWNDIAPIEFGRPPKLASKKILRNGKEDLDELTDLKFTISQNKAFELIEGASIYKDSFSCLREIIQNAEDASKIQLWRDIKSGMFYCEGGISEDKVKNKELFPDDIKPWIYKMYTIKINIEKDENNNARVSISDHGTGIAISTLKSMCNVGESSLYKAELKKEIEDMPVWLKPTANFGVGLQSCFLATDRFTILTNSNSSGTLKITFESGKESGYVNVEKLSEKISRGSTVELTFKENMQFKFDMWGFTAQNLRNVEPFESNCIIIYRIIESIFKECSNSWFDIQVTSNEINFDDKISCCFSNELFEGLEKYDRIKNCKYKLKDNNKVFICWINNTLFNLSFSTFKAPPTDIHFKGKSVKSKLNSSNHMGFSVYADIYGMSTKCALPMNRESLTSEANNQLALDLEDAIKLYLDLLQDKSDEIKDNSKLVDSYFLTSWLYEKDFPIALTEYLSTEEDYTVLHWVEKEYQKEQISLRMLGKYYPKLPYIENETDGNRFHGGDMYSLDSLIEIINESRSVLKSDYIIADEKIKEYLKKAYSDKYFLKTGEKNKKDVCVCRVNISNDLYQPDENTKNVLIKKLVYDTLNQTFRASLYDMRLAIPAFKDYEVLATKLNNLYFIGVEIPAKWYIISPISHKDYSKITALSEDAFVENITNSSLFENIVNYVLSHCKTENPSRDDIVRAYEKLIREYYKIAKN